VIRNSPFHKAIKIPFGLFPRDIGLSAADVICSVMIWNTTEVDVM
jgi:hypothetical protein